MTDSVLYPQQSHLEVAPNVLVPAEWDSRGRLAVRRPGQQPGDHPSEVIFRVALPNLWQRPCHIVCERTGSSAMCVVCVCVCTGSERWKAGGLEGFGNGRGGSSFTNTSFRPLGGCVQIWHRSCERTVVGERQEQMGELARGSWNSPRLVCGTEHERACKQNAGPD